ncbi:ankyrin repeat domain-containing protein [Ectopseudomonas mendocina]|uniref:Ankyrin repeat domain-containing protein n=1 Tax=Ectopseudomonas mendocina TaxID=300 RepID=A0ABZ2RH61_ECTME
MTRVIPLILILSLFSGFSHAAETADQLNQATVSQRLADYLFNAARQGDQAILNEFIQAGYDLDRQDQKGYTALILAAYNGHADAVDLLLAAGANPCTEDKRGNTALMGAIFKGELRIARTLLNAACNPDQRNNAGQTPAMYAALFQRTEILESLREKGADLEATDAMGNSVNELLEGNVKGTPQTRQ